MNAKHLLISNVFPPKTGGSGRWFWEIYRRLPREQVSIVAGNCDGDREFDAQHGLAVVRENLAFPNWGIVGGGKGLRYFKMFRRLRQHVQRQQITAVHCGTCLPEGLLGLMLKKSCGTALLCYIHGEELAIAGASRELRWLAGRVLNGADLIVANSRHTELLLRTDWNVPAERIRLLHPGVDTVRFTPAARSLEVRKKLGWNARTVVLTAGRLQARKGHDCLIEALPTVKETVPDVLYAIVGDGQERARLEKLVADKGLAGHVVFHGEMRDDQLVECYQQCDLFALPNRQVGKDFEGFGMVLLEAQACGRAVVAGTSGGTAETMDVPTTGRLVNCDRPEPLANVLMELLSDREQLDRMGRAARDWVVDRFEWESLSHEASEIFDALQAGRITKGAKLAEELTDVKASEAVASA